MFNLETLESLVASAKNENEALLNLPKDAKPGKVYQHKKEFRKHLQAIKIEAQKLRLEATKK